MLNLMFSCDQHNLQLQSVEYETENWSIDQCQLTFAWDTEQSNAAAHLRCGAIFNDELHYKFTTESDDEEFGKSDKYLAQLWLAYSGSSG